MEFKFPTAQAIGRLNRELRLPASGREQDWEIELSDPNRLHEFGIHYASAALDDDERFALLCLIVASAQDRLSANGPGPWLDEVLSLLGQRADLAHSIAAYWLRPGDDWEIAPYLRKYARRETH